MHRETATWHPRDIAELRRALDAAPMNWTRRLAVGLTVLISALDGYDVLAMTLAAPAIAGEWQVGKTALGAALASGLAGMAAGSLLIAPLADQVGRRAIVLVALSLMLAGTAGSGFSGSLSTLVLCRLVTGLGIGACMAVINTLAAEYANARWRPLAVATMAVGYPVGSMVGGLVAATLIPIFGWRAIFLCGAAAATVMLPLVALWLPESVLSLAASRRTDRVMRLNMLLARFGLPKIVAISRPTAHRGYRHIFAARQRAGTARMAVVSFLIALPIYFGLTWIPQILIESGFSQEMVGLFSILSGACGIAGGLVVGWLASKFRPTRTVSATMVALGVAFALLGIAPARPMAMMAVIPMIGLCLFGSAAGLYAALAAHVRRQHQWHRFEVVI